EFGEFADGDVVAGSDVDEVGGIGPGEEVQAGPGEVVGEEEFAARGAGAPNGDGGGSGELGFVEAPDQPGDDVGVFGVVVVADAVEVAGHDGVVETAMLAAVVFAELQPGDFGEGVGFVGRLEGTGEKG